MKALKVILIIVIVAAFLPVFIKACEIGLGDNDEEYKPPTASEFADEYNISETLASGVERGLDSLGMDFGDVSSFEKTSDWAEGERYNMYADYELYTVYCRNGVLDSINQNGNKVYD